MKLKKINARCNKFFKKYLKWVCCLANLKYLACCMSYHNKLICIHLHKVDLDLCLNYFSKLSLFWFWLVAWTKIKYEKHFIVKLTLILRIMDSTKTVIINEFIWSFLLTKVYQIQELRCLLSLKFIWISPC